MAAKPDRLDRILNGAMERFGAREILLRHAPGPRWTAMALIDHTRIADTLEGDLGIKVTCPSYYAIVFQNLAIAEGDGTTPIDAVTNMLPVRWKIAP